MKDVKVRTIVVRNAYPIMGAEFFRSPQQAAELVESGLAEYVETTTKKKAKKKAVTKPESPTEPTTEG